MSRQVPAGRLVYDRADWYQYTIRKTGIIWSDLEIHAFINGDILTWGLADGAPVVDSNIGAGSVFFNEVVEAPGYYLIRFFPDRVGFWRIILRHPALGVEVIREFDVVPSPAPSSGLQSSFVQ